MEVRVSGEGGVSAMVGCHRCWGGCDVRRKVWNFRRWRLRKIA